jgi:peptide/nickel transport system substrate-binding protein
VSEGQVLKGEWEASGTGTVRFDPRFWRYIGLQHRPEYANPKAQLDVRVRRALAHTVDREAINEGLYSGLGLVSDTILYPTVPFADELNRVIAKYPLDGRRAETLMTEAGYRKGSDGTFEGPTEGRLQFQVRSLVGGLNANERSIMSNQWKQYGIEVEETSLSQIEAQNGEIQGTYRSMQVGASPSGTQGIGFFTTSTIPGPENRWVGANRGGWSNPEYDRFAASVQSTLDPRERIQVIIGAARVLSDQLGAISLYFNPSPVTLPAAVRNMDLRVPDADLTWNIYTWEM